MGVPWPVHQALLTAFSFIVFCLVSIPLYWHLEAWNVGCVLYIFWVGLSCLLQFINCIIWRNNAINWAPVWGDIVVRIYYAVPHGIFAASLIINRRLYKIASTSSVSNSRAEKRRMVLIDLLLGLSIPLISIALFWFVQGHRFDIWEGVGPLPALPNTYISDVLANGVSVLIGIASACYCIGTLRVFFRRRRQFSELLASNSNLTFNRYFRLMALAGIELLCTVPLSLTVFITNITTQPMYPYAGLTDLHIGFSRVEQYPFMIWSTFPNIMLNTVLQPWLVIGCGIIFFMFFGLAEEARTHYRLAFSTVAKRLGYSTSDTLTSSSGFGPSKGSKLGVTIPSFIQRSVNRRSISSFSDKISIGDFDSFDDVKEKPYSPSSPATSAAGSSTCVSTPVDGEHQEKKLPELIRPDSGVVVDIEVITHRHSINLDVPQSVREPSHMV